MGKMLTKNKALSLASIAVIVGSYACVKIANMVACLDRTASLIIALGMVVLLALVCFLLSKCESAFMGLLAAIIGYKMMPVAIPSLGRVSVDASMLYFVFQKAGVLIFVLLIIKFYKMQNSTEKIKVLPILALMCAVTFASSVSGQSYAYFIEKTGSMLGYYYTGFVCYIIASLVILLVSYCSNYESMRFAAYFEFVAMGINILRRGAVAVLGIIGSYHVSKSIYVWIVIYAGVIVAFYLAKEHKKKQIKG